MEYTKNLKHLLPLPLFIVLSTLMPDIDPLLAKLTALTKNDMQKVAGLIDTTVRKGETLINLIGEHMLYASGKRLRPLLLISVARMSDYDGNQHIGAAAAMELLHSASLLHDDVIDASSTRRNKPTSHTLWGNKRAILVGDYFFAKTLEIIDTCEIKGAVEKLAWCSAQLAKGELMQLYWQQHLVMDEQAYLDILYHKTAALFRISSEIGGMLAGTTAQKQQHLQTLGEEIGMSFQIVDDLLDYLGDAHLLQKDKGRDFAEKKMTYPMILAINFAETTTEKQFWQDFLHKSQPPTKEEQKTALDFMDHHDVFTKVREKLQIRLAKARQSLSYFEDNPYREGLLDFLSYCENRVS